MRNLLVTGGAGFIGSNFVRYMLEAHPEYHIVVYDKLTYAGRIENLDDVAENFAGRYAFVKGDICDMATVETTVKDHEIDTIINFAAETHVDRSLTEPGAFIQTDVYGTFVLLEVAKTLGLERYHQISTDEVYGQVLTDRSRETDHLEPRSPYSASKASGDLMVLAYYESWKLPVTITRGSNNVGPYQYPEKVVPLFSTNAIDDQPLPVYGDGLQMRDYQYVLDHCTGIDTVLHKGKLGEIYNVGSGEEMTNIEMTKVVLQTLGKPESLIKHVEDRAGHDRRYALDVSKLKALGWSNAYSCPEAVEKTALWYRDHEEWWRPIKSGDLYKSYYSQQYSHRLKDK